MRKMCKEQNDSVEIYYVEKTQRRRKKGRGKSQKWQRETVFFIFFIPMCKQK